VIIVTNLNYFMVFKVEHVHFLELPC